MLTQDLVPQALDIYGVLKDIIIAGAASTLAYLFARRKNASETAKNTTESRKNESEIIKNLLEIISDLEAQLEVWIGKVQKLSAIVNTEQGLKDDLRKDVAQIREEKKQALNELTKSFRLEKISILDSINKTLEIINNIVKKMKGYKDYPEYRDLRMDSVRIVEMLYSIKEKLER